MGIIIKYFFFRCYHCGEWYYSNKIIKKKKCWKCNRSFQFKNSTKFSKKCNSKEAIEIIKQLKKKVIREKITNFINIEENFFDNNKE